MGRARDGPRSRRPHDRRDGPRAAGGSFPPRSRHDRPKADIAEKIEEDLPETAEDQSEWNWLALSKWVNVRVWTQHERSRTEEDRPRRALADDLTERRKEAIERFDYSPLDIFTDEQFGRRSLCGWLHQQFTLEMRPEEFDRSCLPRRRSRSVRRKIEELYRQKEIEFPVAVGMTNFMAEGPGGGGERYNREGLIRWANDRFQAALPVDEVKDRPRNEIESLLRSRAADSSSTANCIQKTDEYLDKA